MKKEENNKKTTEARVTQIIVDKLGINQKQVTSVASFTHDLGCTETDVVELIMEFEKEFQIAIPSEWSDEIATIKEVLNIIKRLQSEQ